MTRTKRQDPLARRNRANKNRGRAFENRCAKALGWTRVPYSGAQKGWGAGDVVDRFYERDGKWMAECKITVGQKTGISIKGKWRKQMVRDLDGRLPLLFFARKGSSRTWVLMPYDSWREMSKTFQFHAEVDPTEQGTFLIQQWILDHVSGGCDVYRIVAGHDEYFLMDFDYFTRQVGHDS